MNANGRFRIAIVSGSLAPPTFIFNLANALQRSGHSVFMIGKKFGAPDKKGIYRNVATDYKHLTSLWICLDFITLLLTQPRYFIKARRLGFAGSDSMAVKLKRVLWFWKLLALRPDVVHFQWVTQLLIYRNILNTDIKIALSLRGKQVNVTAAIDDHFSGELSGLLPRLHGVHAVSADLARKAMALGCPSERVKVVYSSINDSWFTSLTPSAVRAKPFKILSVGRFHWLKGYRTALDGLAKLRTLSGGDFTYTLVASGEISSELLFQMRLLDLERNVIIRNGIPHAEVMKLMKESDVLLLPSYIEGIANVAIEAMATGLPVISSLNGGMNEIVNDRVNGLLFTNYDDESMAAALHKIWKMDPRELDKIKMAAQATVKEQFSEHRQVGDLNEFYTSICG
jgi:colanic acid/amylovoran biosynthesis glycosyltransferase